MPLVGDGLIARVGSADLTQVCADWRERVPYPTAVLLLDVNASADVASARAVAELPMPVVAHADGAVRDAALELWLACDLRISGPAATFGVTPHYIARAGLTYRLPRLVGRSSALDLLLARDKIDAAEALRIGLATRTGSEDDARALFARLSELPPIAARYAKEAVTRGLDLTLEQALRFETDLYALLQTTADRAEGLAAYRAKRPPSFRGY